MFDDDDGVNTAERSSPKSLMSGTLLECLASFEPDILKAGSVVKSE